MIKKNCYIIVFLLGLGCNKSSVFTPKADAVFLPKKIIIESSQTTLQTQQCNSLYATPQDNTGNRFPSSRPLNISLADASSEKIMLYQRPDCSDQPVSYIALSAGAAAAIFYFKMTRPGTFTVHAVTEKKDEIPVHFQKDLTVIDSELNAEKKPLASTLKFENEPVDIPASTSFSIQIAVQDKNGNLVEDFQSPIVITIIESPPLGSKYFQTGTLTITASQGKGEFKDLSINTPGNNYRLQVSSEHLKALSKTFNILPPQSRDITVIFNGKRKSAKFIPPNIIEEKDGDRFPVYPNGTSEIKINGVKYRVQLLSPDVVTIDQLQ